MTSASSTRSESPADIDFSVIRTSIEMGHKMIDQILNGIHYGSDEVRTLLREECDFILECKVCRNLFRSFPNFVAHKRVYCMEYYKEKIKKDDLMPVPVDEETVVIQPEAPVDGQKDNFGEKRNSGVANSDVEKVINKTFEGKSKEYQFYTKVAEDLEKRKVTKVTNTVKLNPIATTSKAVEVIHSKGDKSTETMKVTSPKKLSPVKISESTKTGSPAKKKNTVLAICTDLTKKKILQGEKEQITSTSSSIRLSTRSRKSSPRKSIDYVENTPSGAGKTDTAEEDVDMSEWYKDTSTENSKVATGNEKEWMKFCDVKNCMCKICKKSFSSLYNLKFHAKMKHVSSVAQYTCPVCDSKFSYFTSLARHLRKTHHKSEAYINNIKMKVQRRKSTESMETDQEDSSAGTSSVTASSPEKVTGNLLSYSTGWKKCDKCGKVCWKAKSFYRHYATCKGPITKENSKSATNSPVKSGKPSNDRSNGGQRNNTALLKLQEKLRAGVIQPNANVENTLKTKLKERNSKSESDMKNSVRDKKTPDKYSNDFPELFKTLTRPLTSQSEHSESEQDTLAASNENSQAITCKMNLSDEEDKVGDTVCKVDNRSFEETDKDKEVQANIGSPAFKRLEERLVREAGLKESQKPEKLTETTSKPYGTRNAAQLKSNVTEPNAKAETKETPWRGRNLSSEINKEDNLTKVKEQRVHRESPEIKELEEKLTREALGHKKQLDEEETNINVEKGKMLVENLRNEKRRTVLTEEDPLGLKVTQPEINKVSKESETRPIAKRISSIDAESRKEKISERLREKMAVQELMNSENKMRLSRSVSKETDKKEEKLPDKTPEKMKLMTNLSPVCSPTRSSVLPSSPTPSVQSSSGDSYNMKFKMTVQEMAELVESASLTKFAKERKKRARNILNTKQVKESQKVAASLAKPMKKRVRKKNIILRNVYGTRNKKGSDILAEKKKNVYGTRSSTGTFEDVSDTSDMEHGNLVIRSRTKSADTSSATESNVLVSSRDSSTERQVEIKRLSREQKRLLNSEGFVEKNFYAVTSSRDSSKDKPTQDSSKDRASQVSPKDRSSRDSSKDRPSRDSSKDRPSRDSSKDGPSRDSSKDRPSRDSLKDKPSQHSSKDRQVDTVTEMKRLAREMKRLESSEGFYDKGFHYESDSSVDRDRHTSSKCSKSDEKKDVIHQANKGTKVEKSKDKQPMISKEDVTTGKAPVKVAATTDTEKVKNSLKMKEKPVEDEKLKQTSSVKKTVLYLGKDFTERIKNIQHRTVDVKQENMNSEKEQDTSSEQDNEQASETQNVEQVEAVQTKPSKTPALENKTKILSNRKKTDSESQTEESGTESKDEKKKSKRTVSEKSDQSELKEDKKKSDSPTHRTRLATGSIFFDSELLKLSPTKAEKKAAELNRISEAKKGGLGKSCKSDSGIASVKKRLTLSPRKEVMETKSKNEGTKTSPQRYSLSTGVKQCQKCNRKFWKKKAYVYHMTNSPCGDRKNEKYGKKRTLSLSPESNISKENKEGRNIANRESTRTFRTGVCISNNFIKENKLTEDQTEENESIDGDRFSKKRRVEVESRSSQNKLSNYENEYSEYLKKRGVEIEDRSSIEKLSKVKEHSENSEKTKKEQTVSESEFNVKSSRIIEEGVKNKAENSFEDMNRLKKNAIKDQKLLVADEENKSDENESADLKNLMDQKAAKPEVVDELENVDSQNTPVKNKIVENLPGEMDEENQTSGEKPMDTERDKASPEKIDEFQGKIEQDSNTVSISDEIPGPSTSVSSVFSEGSDENGSDFSGFSEDDLKLGEHELAQMDIIEQEDLEGEPLDFGSDDDLGELSDDNPLDDEDDIDVKPDPTSTTVSQRPVRKSAQNRFAHVEEIWVYKEPGKPIVEKTKGVKNREYVIDLKNPSKLQCHNSKDVDKLIDEKNLKCRQCETPCTSISNLRRHVIRHLGWKRYKCKHCAYACYDMSYCRQHVLRAHDEKLTSKNFNKFIIDLKKEATKKRAAKRTSTLHKSKKSSTEEDISKKLKTVPGPNTAGLKVNSDQTDTGQGLNVSSVKDSRKSLEGNDKAGADSNKVVVADFLVKSEKNKSPAVRKQTPDTEKVKLEQSPLDKARMNLVKALHVYEKN